MSKDFLFHPFEIPFSIFAILSPSFEIPCSIFDIPFVLFYIQLIIFFGGLDTFNKYGYQFGAFLNFIGYYPHLKP